MNEHLILIGADGAQLPADATGHVAVTDTRTNLMWSVNDVSDDELDFEDAGKACAALNLAGFTDWRLPTVEELFLLADRTRTNPAIDTEAFPTCKGDWYRGSTPYASDSGCAWLVYFGGGDASIGRHDYEARVRAVRSVASSARQ